MRILHVIQRYWPYVGGSELYFQELSERMAAQGHQVTVYTTNAWDLEFFWSAGKRHVDPGELEHNGVRVRRFPVHRLPFSEISYHGFRRIVLMLSRIPAATPAAFAVAACTPLLPEMASRLATGKEEFDLVHAGNIPFDAVVSWAQAFAARRRIPFVMTPFTHLGEKHDDAVRRHYTMPHQLGLMKRSDAVVVQTSIEAEFLANRGVPRRALRRGGVGIEPAEIEGGNRERFRQEHNIEGPIVYFLGTLAHDKGAVDLVEAMRRLWSEGLRATLVLGGASVTLFDRYWDRLPEDVKRKIRRIGHVIGQEKRDLLAAGDVFAMPSRTDSFGIVYLEAWISGAPVIGASAGGVAEVIRDGEDGLLVKFGDTAELAGAIRTLLEHPELSCKFGAAGRKRALGDYTWEKVTGRVANIYEDLTRRR